LPQSWLVTSGLAYQEQGINRLVTTVNLNIIKGIHFGWDSYERLVKMERSEKELEGMERMIDSNRAGAIAEGHCE